MNKTRAINILKKQIEELENITPYKMWKVVKSYSFPYELSFENIEVIGENYSGSMYCKLNLNERDNKEWIKSYNYRKTKEEALQVFIDNLNHHSDKDLKRQVSSWNSDKKTIEKAKEMLNEMEK